jgi:hypothetical protein
LACATVANTAADTPTSTAAEKTKGLRMGFTCK